MIIRMLQSFVLMSAVMLLCAGCAGPTRAGQEARADARARIDGFQASFTYERARQYYGTGEFEKALREIDLAVTQAPGAGMFHVMRGRILLEVNRLEAAEKAFTEAISLGGAEAEAQYYLGIVCQRWRRDEEALSAYQKALELEPENLQYLVAAAEMLLSTGQVDRAGALVESRLRFFESSAVLLQLLAQVEMLQGNPRRASELLLQARMLDPENTQLLEEHLWAQWSAQQYNEAVSTAESLRRRTGRVRPDLAVLEARCLAQTGQLHEAHARYRNIVDENPTDTSAWIELGLLSWDIDDRVRMSEAARRVQRLAPGRPEGWMLEGAVELSLGRAEAAVPMLQRAVDRDSTGTAALILLGRAFETAGRPQDALHAYRTAVARDPASQDARWLEASMVQFLQARADN